MSGSPLFPLLSEFSIARCEASSPAEVRAVRDRFCVPAIRALLEAHSALKERDQKIADLERSLSAVRKAVGP